MTTTSFISKALELSPATLQVDFLVFGPAPDTQPLSALGARGVGYNSSGLTLDDGAGTLYYDGSGKDYLVNLDSDGYAVSITTIAGGALDAGGAADATYKLSEWAADDVSQWVPTSGAAQVRVTVDASAGGPVTFDLEGRADSTSPPFPLGATRAMIAGEVFTRNLEEKVSAVRVNLTGVTGPVKALVQVSTA